MPLSYKRSKSKLKPGRLFNNIDFPIHYFSESDFTAYNSEKGIQWYFLYIFMYSYVRYSPKNYNDHTNKPLPRDFILFIRNVYSSIYCIVIVG